MHISTWLPSKNFYGWIDNNLEVHDVGGIFKHAQFFKNHPKFEKYYSIYEQSLNSTQRMKEKRLNSSEFGEEIFMHRFLNDDTNSLEKFYKNIYKEGWIRLVVIEKNKSLYLEAQGTEKELEKIKKYFIKFKNNLNLTINLGYVIISKHPCQTYDIKYKIV